MTIIGVYQIIAGALLVVCGGKIIEMNGGLHTLGLLALGYGCWTLYNSVQHIDPDGRV